MWQDDVKTRYRKDRKTKLKTTKQKMSLKQNLLDSQTSGFPFQMEPKDNGKTD